MINTLLVANRGEIACRIMRTAKAMGIKTVAVHSAIDSDARHVREADIAINLGGIKPTDNYLRIDALIAAAKSSGAQAIHPGYGFLSENAHFARSIEEAGLIFLGPPASAIDAMGNKSAAMILMEEAGVPLVPGFHGNSQDIATFRTASDFIGYPVLLKAVAGGDGKGMKVVTCSRELEEALSSAQREALLSFGDSRMLVEKYVLKPRHVEIQIFADQHGNCLYLNDRDCSIQRRHQKIVEEAPAPRLTPELRQAMGEAAVKAAKAIGYVGAGTVKFLLDDRGEFFFREMNTRLQVEHPVTEAITGLDLVALQIRVACGAPLLMTQSQVPLVGHAIEVRLYAEDPDNDFLPSTGTLDLYRESAPGPGRRVDSGVSEGDVVSAFYDPMLGKLIAWGDNREEARLSLLAMLSETQIGGVKTNLTFLRRVLAHPEFVAAELDTGFIPRHQDQLLPPVGALTPQFWQVAGEAFAQSEPIRGAVNDPSSPRAELDGWRAGTAPETTWVLTCQGQIKKVSVNVWPRWHGEWIFCIDGKSADPGASEDADRPPSATALRRHHAIRRGNSLYLEWQGELLTVTAVDPIADEASHIHSAGLTAPMNGSIVRMLVAVGQEVVTGTALVVLNTMKMKRSIRAPRDGVIKALYCREGERVNDGATLVELEGIE